MIDLLPQDAAVPQLSQALDNAVMAAAFADVLRPHGVQVNSCTLERVKYRPGRNASLAYRLLLRDSEQRCFEQHVAARLCEGDGLERGRKARAGSLAASAAGPALHWLPQLDMLSWWWPNDAKLHAPRVLACERTLREQVLPQLMPTLGVQAPEDTQADINIVQYVPERRLCARVDLRWREGGETHSRCVYAKASREPDGASAHGVLAQLQASDAWREGRLHTPRALLLHGASGLYWQESLPGQALQGAAAATLDACMVPLGEQLATLHAVPVLTDNVVTRAALQAQLNTVVTGLLPVLDGAALRRAGQALSEHWHVLDGAAAATLHGDLHGRNILVEAHRNGPSVALIDLDGACRGPAALELGAWVADRMYRALLDGASPMRDRATWEALIDAYVDAGGARPAPQALRWATAWCLLTQRAWRCVTSLKPGRLALAPALVECSAQLADMTETNSW